MNYILYALAASLWIGVLWRGRGGAFASVTGIEIGDTVARLLCGLGIGVATGLLMLARGGELSRALAMIPGLTASFWLGDVIAAWSRFQRMAQPGQWVDKPSLVAWLLKFTPLKLDGLAYDVAGMSLCGLNCMAPSALLLSLWVGWHALALWLAGALFGPVYLMFGYYWILPQCGQFADGRSWSEFFAGLLAIGPGLALALLG